MRLIDIRSAIAGAGLAAGIFGLVSMTTAPPYHVLHIQTEGVPTPNQMMRVVEGTPFTVPGGKVFVLTGLGESGTGGGTTTLSVDGVPEVSGNLTSSCWPTLPSILPVASGFAVQAGSVVEVTGAGSASRAWGYLADA